MVRALAHRMEESPSRNSTVPPSQRAQRASRPSIPDVGFVEPGSLTPLENAIVRHVSSYPPMPIAAPVGSGEETMMDARVPLELLAIAKRSVAPVEPVTAPPPPEATAAVLSEATFLGVPAAVVATEPPPASPPTDLNATLAFGSQAPAFAAPVPAYSGDGESTITTATLTRDEETVMGVPSALLFGLARAPAPASVSVVEPALGNATARMAAAPEDATIADASLRIPESLREPAPIGAQIMHDEETITSKSAEALRLVRETLRSDAPPALAKAQSVPPQAAPIRPPHARSSSADDVTVLGRDMEPELVRRFGHLDKKRSYDGEKHGDEVDALFAKLDAHAAAADEPEPVLARRNSLLVRERRVRFRTYVLGAVVAAALLCLLAVVKHLVSRAMDSASDPVPTAVPSVAPKK